MKKHKEFILSSLGVIAVCLAFATVFIITGGDGDAPDVAVSDSGRYLASKEDLFFKISEVVGFSRSVVITAIFTGIALLLVSVLYFKLEHSSAKRKN